MRLVTFLDLDDTLFQTRPKCPPGASLRPAAFRRDGVELSFMTDQQARLFELLDSAGTVIPTTARNLDAFTRVHLPFRSLAILDFGGVVLLPDGGPDPAWDALVRPSAEAAEAALESLFASLQAYVTARRLKVSVRLIRDFDLPLYVVLKHLRGDIAALEAVHAEALANLDCSRFFVHLNDNNLSVVPRFLGKEKAVRYVLQTHLAGEPLLTLGIGDSWTDLPFMRLCDFVVSPRDSQLAAALAGGSEKD
jgi:hypothetical protein